MRQASGRIIVVLLVLLVALGCGGNPTGPSSASGTAKIMPLGDSVTQGQQVEQGYRRGLWLKLNAAGFKVDFVGSMDTPYIGFGSRDYDQDHEGHWGWTADRILASISEWAAQADPDIVLLHIGTNDLIANESVDETVTEIRQIISALRQQNSQVTILLAQVIPGGSPKLHESIVLFNARLADATDTFQAAGSPVILVDQFTGFDSQADTFDGLHPNAPGAAKMVEIWFAALEPVLRGRA